MNDRDRMAALQEKALDNGDQEIAIQLARKCLSEPFIADTFAFNSSGILINFGNQRVNEELIQMGIQIAKTFVSNPRTDPEYVVRAKYNLSNGYGALAFVCERKSDHEGRLSNWRLQREELQKLALDRKSIPTDLVSAVLTNFGNVMDQLGRSVEAIDLWNQVLLLDKDHPVALGSKGQAYLRHLGIQPRHNLRLLEAARICLEQSLSDPENIARHTDHSASTRYKNSLAQVEHIATDLVGNFTNFHLIVHQLRSQHQGWSPDLTLLSWARSDLLLTVNPFPEWCPDTLKDDLFFDGLGTKANESGKKRFTELANSLNQIKEDFALARYLLLQATRPEATAQLSSVTHYAGTLDYADFGLPSALIKSSLRTSVDILDKIANFMNRYFELQIPDRIVSFSSVWYDKGITDQKKRVESPLLAQLFPQSVWLRGLRDIADNLNLYPAPSKNIRNKATHDYLIIENAFRPSVVLQGQVVTPNAHEYARQLLMMVKGAIVNLIAIVQHEEAMKKQAWVEPRIPIEFRYTKGISDRLVDGK